MKILITGASSYVGARVFYDLEKIKRFKVLGTYHKNRLSNRFIPLNTTNNEEVEEVVISYLPDTIIHIAANANSRWCEANPQMAIKINETATSYLVNAANKIGAKLIFISSFAAIKPSNLYGRTKYNSERIVEKTKNGFNILRPSLIIGFSPNITNDRPFNRLLKNLSEGTPAIYDTSWRFRPSYLRHISEVITEIIQRNINREVIPVVVDELKTRYEIAKDILTPFGVKVTPIDKHDQTPVIKANLSLLDKLSLPKYTYQEMISKIIEEIKNRDRYQL